MYMKQAIVAFGKSLSDRIADCTGIEAFFQTIPEPKNENDIILDMQGFTQTRKYTCGLIASLTVIEALKKQEVSWDRFFSKAVFSEDGMSTNALISILRRYGIRVSERRDMTFDQIARAADEGFPVITTVSKGNHWITVVGVRLAPRMVYYSGNTLSFRAARKRWKDFRNDGGGRGECLVCSG